MKDKEVGTTEKIQVSQKRGDKKYFHIFIGQKTSTSLNIQHKDLAKIKFRNMKGKEKTENRKLYKNGNKFKVSIPVDLADYLDLEEGELVDLFISKP